MKILFVCTGNSCRSPMAEGYLKKRLEDMGRSDITVSSAGTLPASGMCATQDAIDVVEEEGIDISGHRSRMITGEEIRQADLIFVMQAFHKEDVLRAAPDAEKKVYLLKDFRRIGEHGASEYSDIPDPIGKPIEFYRETFKAIKASADRIAAEVTK